MIWLHDLRKHYKSGSHEQEVFSGVELLIPSGIVIGILGERGSGKSTLLKLVAGAELPSSGKVYVQGTTLWSGAINISQQGSMTVCQNLRFLCRLYTCDNYKMEEDISRILKLSKLEKYKNTLWKDVPATHKSSLGHAVLGTLQTDWLLIDGALTRKKDEEILAVMERKIREVSTLFVSGNLKHLRKYCDAGIVIEKGRLHYFEKIGEAIKFYKSEHKT